MTALLLTLTRNDSQPRGEIMREIVVSEFVQVTYDMLRIGPDGDFIGRTDSDGTWHLDDESDFPDRWYTDFTVSVAPEDTP